MSSLLRVRPRRRRSARRRVSRSSASQARIIPAGYRPTVFASTTRTSPRARRSSIWRRARASELTRPECDGGNLWIGVAGEPVEDTEVTAGPAPDPRGACTRSADPRIRIVRQVLDDQAIADERELPLER